MLTESVYTIEGGSLVNAVITAVGSVAVAFGFARKIYHVVLETSA